MTRSGLWLAILIPISVRAQNHCSLSVHVVDTRDRPIAGAQVHILPGASERTDDRGAVTFPDVTLNEIVLDVKAIGFSPAHIPALCRGPSATASVRLIPSLTALDTVRVTTTPVDPTGFRARMAHNRGGYFVTDSAIARVRPRRISDLLLDVPGVTMRRGELGLIIELGGRGAKRVDGKPCPVVYFLDGVPFETSREGIDADISIGEIVAVEVYSVASVPAQFSSLGANCGVVLLWTKATKTRR